MWQDAHDAYLESRILSADPLELVRLLYQAATAAVRDARRYLAEGDISARSRSISKACDILTELATSLDHTHCEEMSRRLAQLYDYMQRRLLQANMEQADSPLAETLGLLSTLSEAWDGVHAQQQPANMPPSPWAQQAAPQETGIYASHNWSL
jgi:flagellar secretion chaperone FliS